MASKNDKTKAQANKDAPNHGFSVTSPGRVAGHPFGWFVSRDAPAPESLIPPGPDTDDGWSATGRR